MFVKFDICLESNVDWSYYYYEKYQYFVFRKIVRRQIPWFKNVIYELRSLKPGLLYDINIPSENKCVEKIGQ